MKINVKNRSSRVTRSELLCVLGCAGQAPDLPAGVRLPATALKDFKGELRSKRLTDGASARSPARRVLLVGLGKRAEVDLERVRRAAAVAVKEAAAIGCKRVDLWLEAELEQALGAEALGLAATEGALLGAYAYEPHKTKPTKRNVAALNLWGGGQAFAAGVSHGRVLAEANAFARDLQNAPGNKMRPRDLAEAAREVARRNPRMRVQVLDAAAMKRLGMGALLGVSKGSSEPPQLIHLVYRPKGKPRSRVALVGKGLTFDAGGISLKPAAKMWDMKYDMSGGAAVLGVFYALARRDVQHEVHGIVPASENLPDANASKPGDLCVAMNGTTIEVLNTDAEGRLILCDALSYAVAKVKPDTIIDLATLTGAVVTALGHELSGLFATSDGLRDALCAAGEEVGERLWPLPLFDFHKEQMKGEVADLRNINSPDHGNGATAGAAFLSHFVGDTEWAHLDIAGTAWGGRDRDWVGGPQGSGVGVRLLMRYLENKQ
jgi:leucyl aminopeptidase